MKKVIGWVLLCVCVLSFGIVQYLLSHSIRLPDTPDADNITKIIVEHTDYPGDRRKYVDTASINMAQALLGALRYEPIRKLAEGTPVVRLTYVLDDGSEVTVEANDQTVWWKGKTHVIYEQGEFIKQCATFFYERPLDPYQEYRDKYSTND